MCELLYCEILDSHGGDYKALWHVMPCNLVEVYQSFRESIIRVNQLPRWWRQQNPLKCQYSSTRLHDIACHNTANVVMQETNDNW